MKVVKLIFLLSSLYQFLPAASQDLIYAIRDGNGHTLFSIHLNGTDKPETSSYLFNMGYDTLNFMDSMECTGNSLFISAANHGFHGASNLFQFSLNGVRLFHERSNYKDIIIRYDWLTGNLYFRSGNEILVGVKANSTFLTKVIIKESSIGDFQLNPNSGLLYFSSDWKIMVANMDGSGVKEFVSIEKSRNFVLALAIDFGSETLYWRDQREHIGFARLDGSERGVIIEGEEVEVNYHYINLIVYNDQLIYINKMDNIKSISKHNGSELREWKGNSGIMSPLTICDKGGIKRIKRENPCEGQCSHLCVLSNGSQNGFECLCPDGRLCDGVKDCGGNEEEELCVEGKPNSKLDISDGESGVNWFIILILVLGLIAIISVGGGIVLYRKIKASRSRSAIFRDGYVDGNYGNF